MSIYTKMTNYEKVVARLSLFQHACTPDRLRRLDDLDHETYDACVAYVAKTMGMSFSQLTGELHAFYLRSMSEKW